MRNIEQCHFCKLECEPQGENKRFFLPAVNEVIDVPDNMAKCAIFRLDIRGILLRPNEEIIIRTPYHDGETKVSTEQK